MRETSARASLRIALLAGCLLAALAWPSGAGAVALETVDTYTEPIYVTAPTGDPRLFVVERGGTIKVVEDGTTLPTNFLDISARTTTDAERGLLSMAFDPNYATNGFFYVFYTGDGNDANGALGDIHVDEFKVSNMDPNVANAASRREVLLLARGTAASNHNGGQLQFGKDGKLYISVGEATIAPQAQDNTTPHGKLLRIDPHGVSDDQYTIPDDNPFKGVAGARGEIWALGLRNPFRFSVDHLDGSILIGDVGGGAFEEVDYLPPSTGFGRGLNLGWPCREGLNPGPVACTGTFTDPILDYPHSGCPAYAVVGGFVYRGSDIPELSGRYLYSDTYCAQLRSIQPALPLGVGDRSEGISIPGNPVSFGEDSRCELYVADISTGVVSKLVAFPGAPQKGGGCVRSAAAPAPPPLSSVRRRGKCHRKKTKAQRRRCHRKAKRKRGH